MNKNTKLLILIIFISFPLKTFSETNLTPWNFKITTNDDLIYAGDTNIALVKDILIEKKIVGKNQMNNLLRSLDSKKIIYIFSKTQSQNAINANTQLDSSFMPSNETEIQKLCKDLNSRFNSMVKVKLQLSKCNLEFYKGKISSGKFKDNVDQKIKSILFYGHQISKYNRNQLQYYIRHSNKLTTFTLGCVIGECDKMHKELIEIIDSIEFV